MKLGSIMIGSDNPSALGEFYTKVFGKPAWQQEGWYGFYLDGSSLVVGQHSEVHGKNAMPGRLMFNLETTDVQGEFSRIQAAGATVVAEPYQPDKDTNPDAWLATFADPDGNYFQVATPWKG